MYKLLVFLALYLPIQIALNPGEGIDLASVRILILVIFFVWLAEGLRSKRVIIKSGLRTGLAASFLYICLLSLLVAQNSDWAIRKLLFLFSVFPVYFVASALLSSREKILKVTKAAIFGGTTVAIIGIVQFSSQFIFGLERVYKFWAENVIVLFLGRTFSRAVLENPSWLVNINGKNYLRATATFPDPHMFSFFLGMLVPVALALFLIEKKKLFYGSAFIILLACDIMTFSRGGYLGLFSGIAFAVFYYWRNIGKTHKVILSAMIGIFVLALLIPNPFSTRYLSSFDLREGSNKGRIETWKQALGVIEEKPLVGTGIGNYSLEIKPTANYREPIYAHNTYLDIAAETGVLNAFIWIGLLISAIVALIKISKKDILFAAFAASIVIFSVHSFVETAIYSPVVLTLFLLLVSFSNLESNPSQRKA